MLSTRLVRTIETNAEELTAGLLAEVMRNPRTAAYQKLGREELRSRIYDVYRNLGRWIGEKTETHVEQVYTQLGKLRRSEGIPLSEVVYLAIREKEHLWDYVLRAGVVQSAVELYQEEELNLLIDRFFDKVIYFVVRGYEQGAPARSAAAG